MKRLLLAAISLISIFILGSCNGSEGTSDSNPTAQASLQPQTSSSVSSQDAAGQEQDGRGDLFEEQVPDGADVIAQGVFYYELIDYGDYGDGLSPREGAELTNELLASIGLYSDNGGIPSGQCVYISFDQFAVLDSAMGSECYIYSIGIGTPEGGLIGDDYQVIYRVSVDYSGEKTAAIFEDFRSEDNGDGRGGIIESDQGGLPYWNGFDFGPNLNYGEEYEIPGDPGEYLNAAEAAKLTFDTMKANGNIPAYSDNLQYTMTLVDLADINGEECYVYRLDVDEPSGTIGAAYAYAYQSGNIYMQGQGGQWVIPA